MKTKQTTANKELKPKAIVPSRNNPAIGLMKPITTLPDETSGGQFHNDTQEWNAPVRSSDEGLYRTEPHGMVASSDLILAIREKHAHRQALIRSKNRILNAADAFCRRALGWRFEMSEKERASVTKRAATLRSNIEKGRPTELAPDVMASVAPFVLCHREMRIPGEQAIKLAERSIASLVEQLPAWKWCESIRGFAQQSLGVIVGEAGDLSNYPSISTLWKRMGLAVFDGKAQGKRTDVAEASINGYCPRRRSSMHVIGEALMKQNKTYKAVYDAAKLHELGRVKTKIHAHRRAMRKMEKQFLLDLWLAWNAG